MENRKIILKIVACFLVVWLLWTLYVFTISKNILHTYMLLLLSNYVFNGIGGGFHKQKSTLCIGLIFRRSSLLPTLPFFCYRKIDFYMNSDKYILEQLMVKKENTNLPIYY
jgi:hypothetical protein